MLTNCRNDTGKLIKCKATHDALVEPLEKSVKLNVLCKLRNANSIQDVDKLFSCSRCSCGGGGVPRSQQPGHLLLLRLRSECVAAGGRDSDHPVSSRCQPCCQCDVAESWGARCLEHGAGGGAGQCGQGGGRGLHLHCSQQPRGQRAQGDRPQC